MSNLRKPSDKIISDALRDINKKLDDIIRRLGLIEADITTITIRINTGDVDFT